MSEKIAFEIVVKKSLTTVAHVKGFIVHTKGEISESDLRDLIQAEGLLERLTGFRFHINEYSVDN